MRPANTHLHEPLWPGLLALIAVSVLTAALPPSLRLFPWWLPSAIVFVLAAIETTVDPTLHHRWAKWTGFLASLFVTGFVLYALIGLIQMLFKGGFEVSQLFIGTACTWISTVLTFAVWYWRMDGGGIHRRRTRQEHAEWAFLFPQMTLDSKQREECGAARWRPGFVDYVFVSFTASTAFSPTDTMPLTRWAKGMMMLQSTISVVTVILLVGRLVNVMDANPRPDMPYSTNTLKTAGGSTSLNRSP